MDGVVDALSRVLAARAGGSVEALLPRDVQVLPRLFPVLGRVPAIASAPLRLGENAEPGEVRTRGFAALREFFARLADRKPLIVAIDDVQWADADSAALLGAILAPPDPGRSSSCSRVAARAHRFCWKR